VAFSDAESFLADRERARFDCLVLDIQLGGMSGIELNQRLADFGSSTPVIFVTAHDSPEVRELAIRTGCAAYLQKTDSGETVLAAIHQATRRPHEPSTRVQPSNE
jgi:FixJ family two-component response regulator